MAETDDDEQQPNSTVSRYAFDALEARERAAEQLQGTASSIGDGVISTDSQGCIRLMNGMAATALGCSPKEATGLPLDEVFRIIEGRTRQPAENPALRALREGTVVGAANHTLLVARDGSERPIGAAAAPIGGRSVAPVGAVLVFRDVGVRQEEEDVRARLAAIVESSQDAIVSKTTDSIIRSWNAAAERLFGYTAQEAIGRPITMIIPPDRQHEESMIIERVLRGERVEHFETVRVTKHGELRDVSLTISPLRDKNGRVVGASKIARDITAQKRLEQERQRLQQQIADERSRLAEVFRLAPSFLAVLRGPEHVFELANDRYYEIIGNRDVLGKTVREALPEVEGQGFIDLLDRVYQTGEPFMASDMCVRLQRDPKQPAEERFLEFVYQPLRGADGTVSGIIAQGVDLTERKRAEASLDQVTAESERRRRLYETILSNTPDFVYVFSLDHRIVYANEALLTMWNRSWEEAIGKTFLDVGYEQWHAEMHCREIDEVRDTKKPVRGEVPFTGTHGRRIYDYIFVPVFGEDGEVEAVAGTTRDVTERRQMEDALRETDRSKDEFIALLAHELRNPLAPLRNGLQVMRLSENDPSTLAQARGIMERQLAHMVRLIDDLLDISRLSRNKMELRRSRVLLTDIINSAVETARSAIDAAAHQLTVSLPSEPVPLDADLTRLAQVFSNLLTNSAKYTESGGQISLSAERRGTDVVISVRDTGIGIPADALPHVFDMFSQVDRSIERTSGGLGIGLALVKGLVEKHGGTVTATSDRNGQGSTFTVTLPVIMDRHDRRSGNELMTEPTAEGPRRRVLIVDDNRDSLRTMAMMLELTGNDVATAQDGLEAVEAAARFRPELILMDIGMPRLNGHDATRRIRQQEDGPPATIIALTGWGQAEDRALSKAAGCDGHMVKPISLPDLDKLLRELNVPGTNGSDANE